MRQGLCSEGILHLALGVYARTHARTCVGMRVCWGWDREQSMRVPGRAAPCPALDRGLPRRRVGVWGLQPFPEAPPTTATTRHQLQAGRDPLPGTPRDPGPLSLGLRGRGQDPPSARPAAPACRDPLGATTISLTVNPGPGRVSPVLACYTWGRQGRSPSGSRSPVLSDVINLAETCLRSARQMSSLARTLPVAAGKRRPRTRPNSRSATD